MATYQPAGDRMNLLGDQRRLVPPSWLGSADPHMGCWSGWINKPDPCLNASTKDNAAAWIRTCPSFYSCEGGPCENDPVCEEEEA